MSIVKIISKGVPLMTKLLIVDDEPLIQIGIKSMVNWQEHDIEICGTAGNGQQALKLIELYSPDIVITDIKMPIMDGLELAKICRERYGNLPLFIILTSHEEFPLIKEAIKYDIVDYLIKLELTEQVLLESIHKAIEKKEKFKPSLVEEKPLNFHYLYEKFFICLLHNLFENQQDFNAQYHELSLNFSYPYYIVAQCTLNTAKMSASSHNQIINLYFSTIQMLGEILPKYLPCYVISLDGRQFAIVFCLTQEDQADYKSKILTSIKQAFSMINNYFNVTISCSLGSIVNKPLSISESFQNARQIHPYVTIEEPILFFEDFKTPHHISLHNTFNMGLFKEPIQKSFEEYNAEILDTTLTSIIDLFREHPHKYLQALDAACNILYLSLSLLPKGEEVISKLYQEEENGYLSIYEQTSLDEVLNWMMTLKKGLCTELENLHKNHKNRIVANVKKYIEEHITEKLSLAEVASVFNISPNYLSLLFKKNSEQGFSDYIAQRKIAYAKTLLNEGQLKVYEIADQLGFESAFYFSKVFKKIEGCSPRDYKQFK